jgi:uncharacterized protein (TIGR02444 family)
MDTDAQTPDLSLWDFSITFYAKPEIQSACLTLQDQHGASVPLLLCCCWASSRYGVLPVFISKQLQQYTETFSQVAIEPLRAVRTAMKSSYDSQWPTSVDDWQDLRESIKKIELASEYLLLNGLEKLIIADVLKPQVLPQSENLQRNCIANIAVCFSQLDLQEGAAKSAVESILNVLGAQEY